MTRARRVALAGTTALLLLLGSGGVSGTAWAVDPSAGPSSSVPSDSGSVSPSSPTSSVDPVPSSVNSSLVSSSVLPIWSDSGPFSDDWRSQVDAATVIALGLIVFLLAVLVVSQWR